ncbi:hypothetical protein FS749_004603 [Ceratobasidium sp. UAMH 11750]|nr:hypothetical protein FS749_004603 [Ceratobasidium sp. UAMH 11750]
MLTTLKPPSDGVPPSPSLSLASFDSDSDVSAEQTRARSSHTSPPLPTTFVNVLNREADHTASPFVSPDTPENLATIAQLQNVIQHEFSLIKNELAAQRSTPPAPQPTVSVPEAAFADTLRAELALQMAKVSVLEEEARKLRGEKEALRTELERVSNAQPLRAELDAANAEKQRLYIERQGLWDERAGLWRERQSLWDERADLWGERADLWKERGELWEERGELWVVRDKLKEQVKLLIEAKNEGAKA